MYIKFIIIFISLLLLSNLFLLKEGSWFYQDQSFWPKNAVEAFSLFNTQFHAFTNLGYYLGVDPGIFAFNNVLIYSLFLALFSLFGSSGSQIFVSLLGYVLAFISFAAFSSLFFKDRKIQLILALIYTFNPLMYSFRGQGLVYAAAPLFVYSFYKFYTSERRGKYLLLNIFASFLWVANVRFLQLDIFIIVPYLLYLLFVQHKSQLHIKKLLFYLGVNVLVFSPLIYAFLSPLLQKTPGIFNFGAVFNNFVVKGHFYDAFNPFQSSNIILYDNRYYVLLGMGLFIAVLALLLKFFNKNTSSFLKLNLALLVLGMTFFELGYIVGRDLYPIIIKVLPFLTNAPFYGLYIVNIPFIFLLGIIGAKHFKTFSVLTAYFIILAILPLLNLNTFILQKYEIKNIPTSYGNYFVESFNGIPEATHYIPSSCWRAAYMNEANTPTQCINMGIQYAPIALDNPRVISGLEFYLAKKLYLNPELDNLRITHNLKNIIVANDIVEPVDAGPLYGKEEIEKTREINRKLKSNNSLTVLPNENFNHYYYKNKNEYDFFIYSPQQIIIKNDVDSLFDNSLSLTSRPVVLSQKDKDLIKTPIQTDVKVTYKQSQFDQTKHYIKLEQVDAAKPFILHLTQSFRPGWEVIWIDKNEYENKGCIDKAVTFSITNNTHCQYESSLFDFENLGFLSRKSVDSRNHLQGNFVSNTWIITPNDLPQSAKESKELYAVIFYKNQIYLQQGVLLSLSILLLLIIYTLMQEGKGAASKKKL